MQTFLGAKYHLTFKAQKMPDGTIGRSARFKPEVLQLLKDTPDGEVVLNCTMNSHVRSLLLAPDLVTVSGEHDSRRWRVRLDAVREIAVVPDALQLLSPEEVAKLEHARQLAKQREEAASSLYSVVTGMRETLAAEHARREEIINNIRDIILAQAQAVPQRALCSKDNFLLQLGDASFRTEGSQLVFWFDGLRCTYRKELNSSRYHDSLSEFSFELPRIEIWIALQAAQRHGLEWSWLQSWLAFPKQEWALGLVHPHIATAPAAGAEVARLDVCLGTYAPLMEACEKQLDVIGLLKLWREYLMTCSESGGWYPRKHPFLFLPAEVRKKYCSCGAKLASEQCLSCGNDGAGTGSDTDPESIEEEEA